MKRPLVSLVSRRDLAESVVMANLAALLLLAASDAPSPVLLACAAALVVSGAVLAFFDAQGAKS